MGRKPKPANAVERAFAEAVDIHGDEILEAFGKAKDLSEKYGIPFGNYIPSSMGKKFNLDEYEGDHLSYDFIGSVAPVDTEYWVSSTAKCDFYSGG